MTQLHQRSSLVGKLGYSQVFWGLTPIYWKAVATVSTHELLALRVLWAIPFAVVLLTLRDAWSDVWRAVS